MTGTQLYLEFGYEDLLKLIAAGSDDPDTKTACFVEDKDGKVDLTAANEMPEGVEKLPERLIRPTKYSFIGHAERTLIARAARKGLALEGMTMVINWFPCADCALAIAEAGIRKVVANQEAYEARKDDARYKFAEAMAILTESKIEIEWM